MATVYDFDGWDYATVAGSVGSGWSPQTVVTGRFGRGQAFRANNQTGTGPTTREPMAGPLSLTTFGMGFALKYGTLVASIRFLQCFTAGSAQIMALSFDATGHIQLHNAANTVIATGTSITNAAEWHHYGVEVTIAGASGTVEVYLDGVVEITLVTDNFGSTAYNFANLRKPTTNTSSGITNDWDDYYIASEFLGDLEVFTAKPIADGANTDLTPNAGSTRYTQADEVGPDNDTTYNASSTTGHRDTYDMTTLPISAGTVYAVIVATAVKKADAGTRQVDGVVRHSGTNYDNGTPRTVSTDYSWKFWLYGADPTATPWTISSVNAAEFGIKVV